MSGSQYPSRNSRDVPLMPNASVRASSTPAASATPRPRNSPRSMEMRTTSCVGSLALMLDGPLSAWSPGLP